MDTALATEIRKLSEEDRAKAPSQSSVCPPLHGTVQRLEQLRQRLDDAQSVAHALDHFLDTLREIKTTIPTLLANQDPSRQDGGTDREEAKRSWKTAMEKLTPAMERSRVVDGRLKAAGVTLTMGGATVMCQDVVKSVFTLVTALRKQTEEGKGRRKTHVVNLPETGIDSALRSTPSATEEESSSEAKRRKLEEENETKTQVEEAHKTQTRRSEGGMVKNQAPIQRRSSQTERKMNGDESLVQRRAALLAVLVETKEAAEQLGLQEPTLPALQHRYNPRPTVDTHLYSIKLQQNTHVA